MRLLLCWGARTNCCLRPFRSTYKDPARFGVGWLPPPGFRPRQRRESKEENRKEGSHHCAIDCRPRCSENTSRTDLGFDLRHLLLLHFFLRMNTYTHVYQRSGLFHISVSVWGDGVGVWGGQARGRKGEERQQRKTKKKLDSIQTSDG